MELSSPEKKYLTKIGIEHKSTLEEWNRKWDIITLFHVFEHLKNPIDWLRKLALYIENDGTVIIEVPNGNDALLSLYKNNAFADFTYWSAHLYLYTVKGFEYLVNKEGSFYIDRVVGVQRFPLANHLYWLSHGKPGGQKVWDFFDDDELNRKYKNILADRNMTDTLMFHLKKNGSI